MSETEMTDEQAHKWVRDFLNFGGGFKHDVPRDKWEAALRWEAVLSRRNSPAPG